MLISSPRKLLLCLLTILVQCTFAQDGEDSADASQLPNVIIRAFEQGRRLKDVPASIGFAGPATLERFGTHSIVHALNTIPGVRMEERSPGSFRFNIRGSSLRSPFGVRNVKIYYNDIPITDPGGHTYLNQLGYYNFHSVEIIKGPGSSLYGAGTGGVVMIESLSENERAGIQAVYSRGSFDHQNFFFGISTGSGKLVSRGGFQHQQSRGYRNHSELRRDVHSWTGIFRINEKKSIRASFLYGDLFYETPGALTAAEYQANPRAARPGGGGFPGAVQARASVRQKTFLSGLSYVQQFAPRWENKSVLYGMFTELRNPTLRNYGRSSEPHVGGRTLFRYRNADAYLKFNFDLGGEWQEGFSSVSIHKNQNGAPDTLQSMDEINNRQQFLFSQMAVEFSNWLLTGGASWNLMRMRFQRFTPASPGSQTRTFNNQIAPRLALMKKFFLGGAGLNLYSSVSKGFSPPTTAELLPTGGAINLDLDPETGINYDLGLRLGFSNLLFVDVNAFLFKLKNTIVQRRDAGGGDFFINAGRTRQAGIETAVGYPFLHSLRFVEYSLAWFSHTWHRFRYQEFRQLNNDFSGKFLPSEAPHTLSAGAEVQMKNGIFGTITYYFSDRIPLNDANTAYADAYHLLGLRLGFQKWMGETWRIRLLLGAENLLDQNYSLGNDYNGFGGRYFNAAPGRSYEATLSIQWVSKKTLQ